MHRAPYFAPFVALLVAFAGCDPQPPTTKGDGGVDVDITDSDGDTISDADEGAATERDTDGDGIPDYLDQDSDNDGIPDSVEAGDADLTTPPIDSDSDSIPDFIDLDSDNNGIPDADELPGDVDGDGRPNHADLDDDNDGIPDIQELNGVIDPPLDFDGDGVPDYQDRDSDNDTIMDGHERDADTDGDGLLDVHDLDSDNDGIPDSVEAGDLDLETRPVDTDGDGIPDFRDIDSDNDGLSDASELANGTSPTNADTDGDGVSDLIEVGAGTDPLDASDSPRTRGDFVFTVPYMEAPDPPEDTLMFKTSIQFADVYFLFDISGSMSGVINALRNAVTSIMGNLTCADSGVTCTLDSECSGGEVCSPFSHTCIEDPGTSSCVASVWTGTGYYEVTLENQLSLQPDPAVTSAAINTSTYGGTERLYAAVEATATGIGTAGLSANRCTGPSGGRIGCPSFRSEAVRILVAFTDEDSDGGTLAGAGNALMAHGITLVGVNSGSSSSRNALVDLANASGSLDRTGSPLVYDGRDSAVVPVVTAAINEIVEGVPLRVTIDAADEPDDAGDALQFIDQLVTNTADPGCTSLATEDSNSDGVDETYPSVTPGYPVCWDVIPAMNTTVPPTTEPLVFKARLTVSGDGSPLDSRLVYFLIPPKLDGPMGPD